MINIMIPMGGKSTFFPEETYPYPKPFVEVKGVPMIELVLKNYQKIKGDKKFIFPVNKEDCDKYHLNRSLRLLTDDNCEIIKITGATKGAVCSSLMAIEHIDNDVPLIIANMDSVIDIDLNEVLKEFNQKEADAGVICFESIHPRWSYVKLGDDGQIVETAEKKPISKNAIAGFYYFKRGSDFVRASMKSIKKDAHIGGGFFIAPVFNELVLENMKLIVHKLNSKNQHNSFYSPQKIKEYEKRSSINFNRNIL